MSEPMKIRDKTVLKGLGFDSFGQGSNSCEVDVLDGKIVRTRPFDYNYKNAYDPQAKNPWKIEARGQVLEAKEESLLCPFELAYKLRAYSPNRIPFPMKRVDWEPGGNPDKINAQNRGKSKFVRISWDEAAQIIADEIRRMESQYGLTAILAQCDGHGETKSIHGPHGCQTHLLQLLGNYTQQIRTPDSWEGWVWGAKHVWAQFPVGQQRQVNMLKDICENTEMMLYWGSDPEAMCWGWGGQTASYLATHFDKLGIKNVFISPDFNYTAAAHPGKWIPVLPNTDSALQCAIAYTWITEGLYDREYIDTHSIGFEWFESYVMGGIDGIQKTPKWAEEICGVPSRIIKAFARDWAAHVTVISHCNGGGYIRSAYSHEPARLEVVLLAMQGLGKPGSGQFIYFQWQLFGMESTNAGPRSSIIPSIEGCYHGIDQAFIPESFIPKTLIPKAILGDWSEENPLRWHSFTHCSLPASDQFDEYRYPVPGASTIHMIWTDTPCWTTCWNGGNEMIEAARSPKIEFILAQHPWFENDCLFADILLPVNTKFEEEDFADDLLNGFYNHIFYEAPAIEPIGESKSDWECVLEVAKKLGVYDELTEGLDYEGLIHRGWEKSRCADNVSYEDFRKNEYYIIPTAEGWEDDEPGLHAFWRDPQNNPLDTPSGLLEIYSPSLAYNFPDDDERMPYPRYMQDGESHQESRFSERAKDFPLVMMSNHPRWRVHANMDDIPWFQEIETSKVHGDDGYPYEPCWINPADAAELGIEDGDIVEIYNDRGMVLGGAYVTPRIMAGAVNQDHGARLDPLEFGKSDRGGANNIICPTNVTSKHCAGEVTNGFLVGVKKADMDALRARYPEAFARKFDPATGILVDDWIIEGGNE